MVLDLGQMYATDIRQIDVRRASSLNAPATGRGHNKKGIFLYQTVYKFGNIYSRSDPVPDLHGQTDRTDWGAVKPCWEYSAARRLQWHVSSFITRREWWREKMHVYRMQHQCMWKKVERRKKEVEAMINPVLERKTEWFAVVAEFNWQLQADCIVSEWVSCWMTVVCVCLLMDSYILIYRTPWSGAAGLRGSRVVP